MSVHPSVPVAGSRIGYVCRNIEANADFIVRAVNAHDALVAACKGLLERLDEYYAASRITHPPCMKAARLALALASGEESK